MNDATTACWLSDLTMDDPTRKSWSKPKLRRFVHSDKPIEYLELLGEGGEGAVHRVRIEGAVYALKIFHEYRYVGIPLSEELKQHTSPLAHESRAFARLDCIGENGTWAVKCHGWMKLSDEQLPPINRWDSGYTRWAIVKDYIPDPVQLTHVPEIRRKMKIANRAAICPDDILPRNYQGSFLVDLGSSKTWPYVRGLWSHSAFDSVFEMTDKSVEDWQIDDLDGSRLVPGDRNRGRREQKEIDQRMRKKAEERAKERAEKAVEERLNLKPLPYSDYGERLVID
ncbi:hypothetical protein FQN54_006699 [Arachnomyces sp. PD_36]|nr:hypothetical protein FQN54_006699 [Arachnomyces sp. PD_36]